MGSNRPEAKFEISFAQYYFIECCKLLTTGIIIIILRFYLEKFKNVYLFIIFLRTTLIKIIFKKNFIIRIYRYTLYFKNSALYTTPNYFTY